MTFFRKAIIVNIAEFICIVIGVVQSIVITRFLGPARIGQYAIILAAMLLVPQLVCLGIPMSYLYHTQRNPSKAAAYLVNAIWACLTTGILGGFVFALIMLYNQSYFGSLGMLAIISAGFYVPLMLQRILARNVLLVKIEAVRMGIMRILLVISQFVFIVMFYFWGMLSVEMAIVCIILSEIMVLSITIQWVKKNIDWSIKPTFGVQTELVTMGVRQSWADLMVILNSQISIMVVRYMVDSFENVGYFSRGQSIALLGLTAAQAILPLLFSVWASLPEEQLNRHVEKVLRFVSTIAVITIVVVLFAGKWIVLLFYGAKFLPSQEPMQILVFGAALYIVSRTFMQVLGSRGTPEISAVMLFISVIINMGLCWALIPTMGINGAAWASTGSNIFLLVSHFIIVQRRYRLSIRNCLLIRKQDIEYVVANFRTRVTGKANGCPTI